MHSALQRAAKPVKLVILDDSGRDAEQRARTQGYEKLLDFLEQHLAAPPLTAQQLQVDVAARAAIFCSAKSHSD